jgi:dipeptidyl aminopeptidase/acylaminoacyl peptidase
MNWRKHFACTRSGVAIAIGAPLFVFAWHLIALAMRPAHMEAIISEVNSVMYYTGVWANKAGTRLLVTQDLERGWGVYFCDIAGHPSKKLIFQQRANQGGYWRSEFNRSTLVVGWSPDDSLLAYFRNNTQELVICDGNCGDIVTTNLLSQPFSSAVWLSSDTIIALGPNRILFEIRKSGDDWLPPRRLNCFHTSSNWKPEALAIEGLAPTSAWSVAWRQGGTLWTYNLDSDAPVKLWDSTTNVLRDFAVLPGTRKFLVSYHNAQGDFLARFYPGQTRQEDLIVEVEEPKTNRFHPSHLALFKGGEGYAFLADERPVPVDVSTLVVRSGPDAKPVALPWRYPIDQALNGYAVSSNQVFLVNCQGDEPIGIWKYDPASHTLDSLFKAPDRPFEYARNSAVSTGVATNASGLELRYFLARPAGESPLKKYPLVIGNRGLPSNRGTYHFLATAWEREHESVVNAGAFYLIVDRNGRDFSQWADDILVVFDTLKIKPEIDTNRVYLLGISAGGAVVDSLLQARPQLWRGAIFSFASPQTNPLELRGKRILIDGGGEDGQFKAGIADVRQWQDDAAKAGILVEFTIHPHVGHAYKSPVWESTKMRQLILMLNE